MTDAQRRKAPAAIIWICAFAVPLSFAFTKEPIWWAWWVVSALCWWSIASWAFAAIRQSAQGETK